MFWKKIFVLMFLAVLTAVAQTGGAGDQQVATSTSAVTSATADQPASKPVARPKSFDLSAMDRSANPCEDFYQFACGTWRKNNPIPSDQSRWGRFNELSEYNRQILHEILEKAAAKSSKSDPVTQKIGDMYASCMDEQTVNKQGADPLKPELDRIAGITNKDQLIDAIAFFNLQNPAPGGPGGGAILFTLGSSADLHDARVEVANVIQSGLGLPDRDYYLNKDAKSQETRTKYEAHLVNMFKLIGDDDAAAQKEAKAVMNIETQLADAAFDRVKMRDPQTRDHKMAVSELNTLAPNFEFQRYFQSVGAPSFTEVNVVPPDFFQKANGVLGSVPVDDWKSYLRAHVVRSAAPYLSDPFVQENFDFTLRYLSGQKELQPRWKRCVQLTDRILGEALGQPYVKETFGTEGKERMLAMVNALEDALGTDIQGLSWMTPDTKKQAEGKLKAITNKIGYPDKWRDYSTVKVARGDLLGNVQRAAAFERQRNLKKIGGPLNKKEWTMSPPTVNAYYNSSENDINFPAGILQPPFFDRSEDDAVNFGGIGVVIGHELTHGFDDQGSKFDADGNLKNWWTDADRKEFDERTGCIATEYGSFVPVDDLHLNGRLTLGENTADNGGARIALMALHNQLATD